MIHQVSLSRKLMGAAATLFAAGFLSLVPTHQAAAATAAEINRDAAAALNRVYARYPGLKGVGEKAKGILVFPKIVKAGLMIGGESGDGVLQVGGKPVAYYNTSGVSYGVQAGAQTYGYVLFLMTDAVVRSLESNQGLEVGVGPSVVVMDDGMARKVTTTTTKGDIYAIIMDQKGMMAGVGIQGSKITRIKK